MSEPRQVPNATSADDGKGGKNLKSEANLLAELQRLQCPWQGAIDWQHATGSTNDNAQKALALGAAEGCIFAADRQSRGRGRQGRRWEASTGAALLVSVGLRPRVALERLPQLSIVVGVALAEALNACLGAQKVGLKWPNDLWVGEQKLGGILVESQLDAKRNASVVVGFGVNRTAGAYPEEFAEQATSLEEAGLAKSYASEELVARCIRELENRYRQFCSGGLAAMTGELSRLDISPGRPVEGAFAGIARGIASDGCLQVEVNGLVRKVVAGEVRMLPRLKK